MCIRINKIILFILSLFLVSLLQAKDMSIYKSACKEKGIAEGTEDFGACVMDLYKNKDKLPVASKKNDKMAPYKSTCSEIGFKEGTEKFGQCVLKLFARDKDKKKQMISEKKRRVEQERAEAERRALRQQQEAERQRIIALENERKKQAKRDAWTDPKLWKSLQDLANSLDPNAYTRSESFQIQQCIKECRRSGGDDIMNRNGLAYCKRVCK